MLCTGGRGGPVEGWIMPGHLATYLSLRPVALSAGIVRYIVASCYVDKLRPLSAVLIFTAFVTVNDCSAVDLTLGRTRHATSEKCFCSRMAQWLSG